MSGPPDFEALYQDRPDPWQVASSWYERRKLDLVLATLAQERYACAWDPACGTGHLAARLAARADRVLASDLSETAVQLTTERCRDLPQVRVAASRLPAPHPGLATGARPDLVVLSEFVYYLDDRERADSLAALDQLTAPGAEVVAVHWRQVPGDAWLGGPGVQAEIVARLQQRGWVPAVHHLDEDFVIDSLRREARS